MRYSNHIMATVAAIRSQAAPIDLMDREKFIENLIFVYKVIVSSERIIADAMLESEGPLLEYLRVHAQEEKGHAEWLCDDLASAGIDAKREPENRIAMALAGSQYYLIKHVSPVCILGYMMVLEGNPIPVTMISELEARYGKSLLRTARYHAIHDLDHRKELFDLVDKIADQRIMENAVLTTIYLNEFQQGISHDRK